MSKIAPTGESPADRSRKHVGRLLDSRLFGWVVNLPPIAWVTRVVSRVLVKRWISVASDEETTTKRVAKVGLEATLQQIVYDVVNALGYAGAMVATYEQGDSLPVRALYVDPELVTEEQIHQWEKEISRYYEHPLSLTDPKIARVFVYEDAYRDNLSVQAFKAESPVITDDLYDLFTPIAPPASRPFIQGIQQVLGIRQCIAVPFFIEMVLDGQPRWEIVGNLFAAKRGKVSKQDELVLSAFGRQAASAIENERRRLQLQVAQELVFDMQSSLRDEEQILQRIVEVVASDLGYLMAMVATYEHDDSLPVRAMYVDPDIATEDQIHQWEEVVSKYSGRPLSLTNPEIARVFVHQEEYTDNLSVRAFRSGGPVISDELYDLFTPVVPPASKPVIKGAQEALGIQQVIAVPFFLEGEIIGNLFTITRSREFSQGEIELLRAFGQQAAAGIRNARLYRKTEELYRKSEERRQVAQVFGKMAFSASAYVHDLRNHIGALRGHFHLLQLMDQFSAEDRQELLASNPEIAARLNAAAEILDNLHEPWRYIPDQPTDVNACLERAIRKVISDRDAIQATEGIEVKTDLSPDLPPITTSSAMLSEAFRVLIKNAVEAIREKGRWRKDQGQEVQGGGLWVESYLVGDDDSAVEVAVHDSGIGIKPENLSKLFEMRWTTKGGKGMGFGLFWTKDYVEGLGGSIEVESVWEKGATFRVRLPAATKESDGS
jgi:signal transduction histidine kinase